MKSNGAQNINKHVFRAVLHLNSENKFRKCTISYTAIAGKPAPTVLVALTHPRHDKNPVGAGLPAMNPTRFP
jgi:hypothetical protein